MPIYEYECNACHETFEELVFGSEFGIRCPKCESTDVSRLMSACAVGGKGLSGLSTAGQSGKGCGSGGFT